VLILQTLAGETRAKPAPSPLQALACNIFLGICVGDAHVATMRLTGKTAIVTGAGSGFGAGIAQRFVEEGARVLVADINGDAANEVAARINASPWVVDVSDNTSVRRMAGKMPNPDIIVNNAGITHLPQPMEDVSEDDFDRIFRVNMKSVFLMSRHFVPAMKARGSGAILNIASTAGISPRPNLNWYNASKGWMITATKAMAVELAPFGIRVNALNPVAGETPLLKTFMGEDTPEIRAKFLSTIPLGRFSTPEDMGAAAAFLCSNDASMITGVAMEVDGGRCI
jgi:3-oxoacyl-[acyl-carrier protein] reductase